MPPKPPPARTVSLRPVLPGDLPTLYAIQADLEGAAMAGVIPRSPEAFQAVWDRSLADPATVARAIIADGVLAGSINRFRAEGADHVGYAIAREHWGRGIATRALGLLLAELPGRPLLARIVSTNAASLRVLERHGFRTVLTEWSTGTERYLAGQTTLLRLD